MIVIVLWQEDERRFQLYQPKKMYLHSQWLYFFQGLEWRRFKRYLQEHKDPIIGPAGWNILIFEAGVKVVIAPFEYERRKLWQMNRKQNPPNFSTNFILVIDKGWYHDSDNDNFSSKNDWLAYLKKEFTYYYKYFQ